MNFYYYWYFTIFSIYKRFSRDKHFDVFATSMFSFFIASLLFGTFSLLTLVMKQYDLFRNSYYSIIIFVTTFIINYMVFLPKKRQLALYNKYLSSQKLAKDILTIIFTTVSVLMLFVSIMQIRKHNLGG